MVRTHHKLNHYISLTGWAPCLRIAQIIKIINNNRKNMNISFSSWAAVGRLRNIARYHGWSCDVSTGLCTQSM